LAKILYALLTSLQILAHPGDPVFDIIKLTIPTEGILCVVVVGHVLLNDTENYAGGSAATGRASHAGQVKGDNPD
jgi:hypothetical protein